MRISDWSSDVCSSDLAIVHLRTMDGLSCLRRGRCGLRRALHEECKTNTDKNKGTDERHPTTIILRSEEHTSELQSLMRISYAVFCLKKKKQNKTNETKNREIKHTDSRTTE